MRPGVGSRYAWRSVRRNIRRTVLSVAGIGFGCALALFVDGVNRGKDEFYVRVAAETGTGHLRVVPAGWRLRRDADLRLTDGPAALAAARALPGVTVAVPRARAQALLAMGTHVVPLELVGADPALEPRADRLMRRMERGHYLVPGERGAAVVGRAVAERLGADLGDEILATAMGFDGEIQSALFRIEGVVATGSEDIDASICQVALEDLEALTGRRGPGEITVILGDWRQAGVARDRLSARLGGGSEVLTWHELAPEFEGHLRQDTASARLVTGLIIAIVLLGVTSAQLAAVLERRREFAVLSALGMSTRRMVGLLLQEALLLGLAGATVGLAVGGPLVWHYARAGLDFSRWLGSSYSFQGIILEPILYLDFGLWLLPEALVISLGSTMLASLYPARFVARTDPAVSLRVAQ